jgi:hypothetical protein
VRSVWSKKSAGVSPPLLVQLIPTDLSANEEAHWRLFLEQLILSYGRHLKWIEGPANNDVHAGSEFCLVSSSQSLNRKLLQAAPMLVVWPKDGPSFVDPWALLQMTLAQVSTQGLTAHHSHVALATSVFRANTFLDGFLKNSAALHGYDTCEHWLVRPA